MLLSQLSHTEDIPKTSFRHPCKNVASNSPCVFTGLFSFSFSFFKTFLFVSFSFMYFYCTFFSGIIKLLRENILFIWWKILLLKKKNLPKFSFIFLTNILYIVKEKMLADFYLYFYIFQQRRVKFYLFPLIYLYLPPIFLLLPFIINSSSQ